MSAVTSSVSTARFETWTELDGGRPNTEREESGHLNKVNGTHDSTFKRPNALVLGYIQTSDLVTRVEARTAGVKRGA